MNSTILSLYSLEQEVGNVTRNSYDQGREHLNNLEIEHLLKMTKHVVMKIKKQLLENAQ